MNTRFFNPALLSYAKLNLRGANSEDILNQNRRVILQYIRDKKIVTRKDLANFTGLKLATITMAIDEFLEKEIIKEIGLIEGDQGRRLMGFSINDQKYCSIAVRVTNSYVKIGVYDVNNQNLYINKTFMNTFHDLSKTTEVICQEIEISKSSLGDKEIIGVAVGVAGPFVLKDGFYKYPINFEKDIYFDLGRVLSIKLDLPVFVNKENNFAVYNLWKTSEKLHDLSIIIYVMISYSIECGIMINGEILNGCCGGVGMLGEMIVSSQEDNTLFTLNDKVTSQALVNHAIELLPKYPHSMLILKKDDLNIRDVIKAYGLGDELAIFVFDDAAKYLGRALANVVNLMNPDLIRVGDEIPTTEDFLKTLKIEVKKHVRTNVEVPIIMKIGNYEQSRDTRIDPSLLGASHYIYDAMIQSGGLLD